MDYTFNWSLAFEQAKLQKRKLLDEHIEKAYYDKLVPAVERKMNSKEDVYSVCTLVIKKFWERFYVKEEELPTNVNGYLYMMAMNAVIDYSKMKKKKDQHETELDVSKLNKRMQEHFIDEASLVEANEEKELQYQALEVGFTKLCEKCRALLQKNIFEKQRIKAIYEQLGFKTPNAATKKKITCINQLKKLVYQEIHNQSNTNTHVKAIK